MLSAADSMGDASALSDFSIVEASIEDHRRALDSGLVTSVELVVAYLLRIATYDVVRGLNSFTVINPKVLEDAQASDDRRAAGLAPRALEGIPYTLKDNYKYAGLTVTNGSPALKGLVSGDDSHVAARLRQAGAILIGKTNMPPMAAGGMQRGLYGRAESPYNAAYLTAAYASGSSNGAATSTAASLAAFGIGSETVSSGRSPASNNALVAYTPSRGVISSRGLWPLYPTCDVVVPMGRCVQDLLEILNTIADPDPLTVGDFWRDQPFLALPVGAKMDYTRLTPTPTPSLAGKRIAVPKIYIGEEDSDPHAKAVGVCPDVLDLWNKACADLEALGAEVVHTDFPVITRYEDDSISKSTNNVAGAPAWWSDYERSVLVAKAWDDFLIANKDANLPSLSKVDGELIFPKPPGYVPDLFLEQKNLMNFATLPQFAQQFQDVSIYEIPGVEQALKALEAQRKADLEDWMDAQRLDLVVFPANGDVAKGDLEFNVDSARHALQNGVKYSNGNRTVRHLGIPTVSVPMGVAAGTKMPVNLTFAGKAYRDEDLLRIAYAYERKSRARTAPPLTPELPTDRFSWAQRQTPLKPRRLILDASAARTDSGNQTTVRVSGTISADSGTVSVHVYLDGKPTPAVKTMDGCWEVVEEYQPPNVARLSWRLTPLPAPPAMVLVVASSEGAPTAAKLLWV